MIINEAQCLSLLKKDMVEEILAIFDFYNLEAIRLFKPITSREKGKINFLVREQADTILDLYTLVKLRREIKKILKRKDIEIFIESNIDEDFLEIVLKNQLDFNRHSLENLCEQLLPTNNYLTLK